MRRKLSNARLKPTYDLDLSRWSNFALCLARTEKIEEGSSKLWIEQKEHYEVPTELEAEHHFQPTVHQATNLRFSIDRNER